MSPSPEIYGALGEFDRPDRLIAACGAAYQEGYRRMEAYTPFPVHGLPAALGHSATRLPLLVLLGGLLGAFGGFFMQWYTATTYYPINVGGKPFNSWPAFIVVTFELAILCAGLTAVVGMLALNGLPRPHHPLFYIPEFELASQTHFFLCIEARDAKFDPEATVGFLEGIGAIRTWLVPAGPMRIPAPVAAMPAPPYQVDGGPHGGSGAAVLILCVLFLAGAGGCDNVNRGMDNEGRMETYEPSPFFENRQSVRPLVEGTVARGQARTDPHLYGGQINGRVAEAFPFPITRGVLERGREQYTIYCAVCHNATGDGRGMIVQRGFVPPPSFHIDRLRNAPVGHFFQVITSGWGAMYAYNDRVSVKDRWAIAAYIRVLQLSQNADAAVLTADERRKAEQAPPVPPLGVPPARTRPQTIQGRHP